ncbi:MAG: NnrS family protein, partial [Burkholderiales bacterium]|nr:NnrS family protein [Burkholderiales bacterium]
MLKIQEPVLRAASPRGFALFALGFRPFYLVASVFAAVSTLLWIGDYAGVLPPVYGHDPVLHAHEMIYGYAIAVIVGFLFTAGRNWAEQPTPQGGLLASFVALWLAGRILVLTPWTVAAAVVDAAFPMAAAIALAVPFLRSRNKRNYFFVGLLFLIGAADLG